MLIRNSKYNSGLIRRLILSVIITLIIVLNSESIIYAQKRREEPPPLRERIFFGGSLGLGFGSITDIDLSPVVGLWVLPQLNVAIGPKYRFYKDYYERDNIYGGRLYSQFFVIRDLNKLIPIGLNLGIFLHAEEELYNLHLSYDDGVTAFSDNYFIHSPLIGGGISQPIGQRASFNFMVLWALYDKYDIYPDPELRVSFTF